LQQNCSGGSENSEGRKGIPVTAIPAREEKQAVGKKSGLI